MAYNQSEISQTTDTATGLTRQIQLTATPLSFQTEEALKMLRANIQFSGYHIKTVAFTSASSNEGKSFVSFELAKSLAALDKRTLFLDCDIRNSVIQSRIGVTETLPGLTEFLSGQVDIRQIIYRTNVKNLNIIFAGRLSPNPSELLSSQLFVKLIEALKKNYDYIICDTAPLGAVIDAAIISKMCDGTALVVESGSTDRREAARVKQQLMAANARVLGVVLNKYGNNKHGYGKYGYGKYGYGRYGYGRYGQYGYDESGAEQQQKKSKRGRKADTSDEV